MVRAVSLLSGGLDSMLAIKLLQVQGIEVHAVHFVSIFNCAPREGMAPPARRAADALGVELTLRDFTATQMEILADPQHGFGSAANPCIDCHMAMLKDAALFMSEMGADFIATGEVLGQRPMSQRGFALALIDRKTGLAGRILRPLSAKAMPETIPEQEGLVDRERLEGIVGRTRTRQMELAVQLGIKDYPTPAGGCLLTDPQFGLRVKDQLAHEGLDVNSGQLLKVGRHFRLGARAKAIVGRDEQENSVICALARPGDCMLTLTDMNGPTTLLRGEGSEDNLLAAAALTARFSKAKDSTLARVKAARARSEEEPVILEAVPADEAFAAATAVGLKKRKNR